MYHNSKHTNYIQLQVYKYTCTYTQNRNTIKETRIITPFPPTHPREESTVSSPTYTTHR